MCLILKGHSSMQYKGLLVIKIILVANKIDLLPKQINHRRVKEWLRKSARKYGLEAEDVVLISANKGWGLMNYCNL